MVNRALVIGGVAVAAGAAWYLTQQHKGKPAATGGTLVDFTRSGSGGVTGGGFGGMSVDGLTSVPAVVAPTGDTPTNTTVDPIGMRNGYNSGAGIDLPNNGAFIDPNEAAGTLPHVVADARYDYVPRTDLPQMVAWSNPNPINAAEFQSA